MTKDVLVQIKGGIWGREYGMRYAIGVILGAIAGGGIGYLGKCHGSL